MDCYFHLIACCECIEPISKRNMIVRVSVVLNRTLVDSDRCFDNLCSSHLQGQGELYHVRQLMVLNSGY